MHDAANPKTFGVTPSLFLKWRSPRFGTSNPEQIVSPVWEWLFVSGLDGYTSTQKMNGPAAFKAGPTLSFDRFGQSLTVLPDGRKIYIGGEHEDHYDPDFFIYNDVVVVNPDQSIEFYCYPPNNFPPTDFHSATPVGNSILIVGNLGEPEHRNPQETPVYRLDTRTLEIQPVVTGGQPPGWIHGHRAILSEDGNRLSVTKGTLYLGENQPLRENIDDWELSLHDWRWKKFARDSGFVSILFARMMESCICGHCASCCGTKPSVGSWNTKHNSNSWKHNWVICPTLPE